MGERGEETREARLLAAIGTEEVLAKGRLYEHTSLDGDLNITGPGSSVLVSAEAILWLDRKGRVRKLAFGTRTILAFSHEKTDAAVAIEQQLIRRKAHRSESIQMQEPTRAERTADSHKLVHEKTPRRSSK